MNAASETAPDPPWGQVALDLHLLEQWDYNSSETPAEQCKRPARAYVQLGWPGRKKYHEQIERKEFAQPSDAAIESVLKPFRKLHQRRIAHYPGYHEGRTDFIDWDMAIDDEDHLLDDAELYNFGVDRQDVFLVLPELLDTQRGHGNTHRSYRDYWIGRKTHRDGFAWSTMGYTKDYVVNFVVVEDEEALQNGNVLLNFVHSRGQVVRQKLTTFDEAQMIGGMALGAAWDDIDAWKSGTVGERYREGGERGPPYDVG
ncbi:hypothetical protein VTN00DRAFT_9471 [Thermoascus crustaceus]|uniref:uncharacterized protein n=1 Tax=Thermoascus crustaceus TaxID=5088 RepID=UPI0037432052